MKTTDKLDIAEWIVIAATVALVSGAYLLVPPRYFDDREASFVIFVGLAAGATVGGSLWRWGIKLSRLWLTVTICGAATAAIFAFSLYIILDRQGP